MKLRRIFYNLKPAIPRRLQISVRRHIALYKRKKCAHIWPIDPNACHPPKGWLGWPNGKQFAFVLIHDVDSQKGHDNVLKLAELEEKLGFRSSFNLVPERYKISESLHKDLRERGFDIGAHGLNHDGKLFNSHQIFCQRANKINHYLNKWNADGFSSPSMHHRLDWMHALDISNCTSTFDTDPFEPQPDSIGTIFPFWVPNGHPQQGFLELPYTLPQDHLLYVILKEQNIDIWKRKIDWIAEKGGMALLNTHADYIQFDGNMPGMEEYPVELYIEFLDYLKKRYSGKYYHTLSGEIARLWESKVRNGK